MTWTCPPVSRMSGNNCILSYFPQHANRKSRFRSAACDRTSGSHWKQIKLSLLASRMKDIFVIQHCDGCVSAAEPPSVDEEEETSAAPGSCSRMWEIIELCKEECNCF